MTYELYLITNLINHKQYIGQTQSNIGYQRRFRQHLNRAYYSSTRYSDACVLHAAIRKYGEKNFTVKRLLKDIEESRIDELEALWIAKLHTMCYEGRGYNMTEGGQGMHGYKHTVETKAIISAKGRERQLSMERNQRISEALKGRPKSFYTRQKLSAAAKKRFQSAPGTFTGKHHSAEARRKLAEANGIPVDALDALTGEVVKQFISATEAARWLRENGRTTNKTANTRIQTICNGSGVTAYGYKWRYSKV